MVKEFHIKEKIFTLGDNFTIRDMGGKVVYEVKGNAFKFGNQAAFLTPDGTELATLEQTNDTKLIPWKKFVVSKGGKEWATAKQDDWGMMDKKTISIDIPGENDYKIIGDRMSWAFDIMKGEEKVGQVNKQWGVVDNYGVRVEDGADEVDVLLCGILVDIVYHDKGDKK